MELGDEVPGGLGSGPDELVDRGGRVEVRREAVIGHAVDDRGRGHVPEALVPGEPGPGGHPRVEAGLDLTARDVLGADRVAGLAIGQRVRQQVQDAARDRRRSVGNDGQLGPPTRGQHLELGPGAGQDGLRGHVPGRNATARSARSAAAVYRPSWRSISARRVSSVAPASSDGSVSRSRAAAPVAPISSVALASRTVPDRRVRGSRATRSA